MSYFDIGATELVARRGYSDMGGLSDVLSKIGGAIKGGAGAALDFYGQTQQQAGAAAALQQQAAGQRPSGTPSWVMPVVAIGGIGLVAYMLMGRKRKNPSRGKGRYRGRRPWARARWRRRRRSRR